MGGASGPPSTFRLSDSLGPRGEATRCSTLKGVRGSELADGTGTYGYLPCARYWHGVSSRKLFPQDATWSRWGSRMAEEVTGPGSLTGCGCLLRSLQSCSRLRGT